MHITVLNLEPYGEKVPDDDPDVARYAAGLRAAAARCGPVRLRLAGLSLAPTGFLAATWPVDGAADRRLRISRTPSAEAAGPTVTPGTRRCCTSPVRCAIRGAWSTG